nr:uncharacterized protein LOC128671266 [Plodia interpunctella]
MPKLMTSVVVFSAIAMTLFFILSVRVTHLIASLTSKGNDTDGGNSTNASEPAPEEPEEPGRKLKRHPGLYNEGRIKYVTLPVKSVNNRKVRKGVLATKSYRNANHSSLDRQGRGDYVKINETININRAMATSTPVKTFKSDNIKGTNTSISLTEPVTITTTGPIKPIPSSII